MARSGGVGLAAASAAEVPSKVRVEVLDHGRTPAGEVWLSLSRADGRSDAAGVRLGVDYAAFAQAFGADWAQRLHLAVLPACALERPEAADCQGTDLPSVHDGTRVSADVPLGAVSGVDDHATGDAAMVVALRAGSSGGTGSFAASSLSASASWSAGGPSGDFTWSYPLRVPPSIGGPAPSLALGYSSQSVDGRTAASNNQPSWVGEGFDFWPGFIERRYASCDDVGLKGKHDLCWGTDNATLSLNGRTVELIKDAASGAWHPKSDDGSRIERLTGAANGTKDGEFWKVTTTEGTRYVFGLHRLPGWQTGKEETRSAWTVPVFGSKPGQPCHTGDVASLWCQQGWRWNLDYVVDVHGNSMSYFYAPENNHYARGGDTSKVTPYTRGGTLTRVDYGTRTDAEYTKAPARVVFDSADRCAEDCGRHGANWPDTPWDQHCGSDRCTRPGPSFWETKRLAKVTTQVADGGGYRNVDTWELRHIYPDPGDLTRAGLWLAAITHVGLPEVVFYGVRMNNRAAGVLDSPGMNWWRIQTIRSETGGQTTVSYSEPECKPDAMPTAPESNTQRCFPVYWTPENYQQPVRDWFHKYVVTAVIESGRQADSPDVVTHYAYDGGAAWHYADDDGITPASRRSWSQWRGYGQVTVTKGQNEETTVGVTRYFRGMHGDHLPTGSRTVSVTDSGGGTWPDHAPLAGQVREAITYNGRHKDGSLGPVVSREVSTPWVSPPTASRTIGASTVTANYVNVGQNRHWVALDAGRGWRESRTVTAFDGYGMPTESTNTPDVTQPADAQCTRSTYARNTGTWLMAAQVRTQTFALACDKASGAVKPSEVIADVWTAFDGQDFGAAPTRGDVTSVRTLSDWRNGQPVYTPAASSTYDAHGRVTAVTDAAGARTTSAYTPATGGPVTKVVTTNALGHVTTVELDPAWGQAVTTVDANGRRTDVEHDGLGRVRNVWLPGQDRKQDTPNAAYTYTFDPDKATVAVETSTLLPKGNRSSSFVLYDGLLRPRQTQAPASGVSVGKRVVADTLYDTVGRAFLSNPGYIVDGAPGVGMLAAPLAQALDSQIRTEFDGAGRPTASILISRNQEKWRTSTYYGGDHLDVTPPKGGTPTSTLTDARGRTVQLRQFKNGVVGPFGADPATFDATSYAYNPQGLLASVTAPGGAVWSYGYDAAGRQVRSSDPDAGAMTATYDAAGRLATTTDARGVTLTRDYDLLGRPTALRQGESRLSSWSYDTAEGGIGAAASASRFTEQGEYRTETVGFDSSGRSSGSRITIPASEGFGATSWLFTQAHNPDGSLGRMRMPAVGGLGVEEVDYTYNDLGQPVTMKGANSYVTATGYTPLGEVESYRLSLKGLTGGPTAHVSYGYDPITRAVERARAVRETAPGTLTDQRYTRNPAGTITAIADTPTSSPAETQCFSHDHLQRLTNAWTPTGGDCAAQPSAVTLGGPAPYWQSYTYDAHGNRSGLVDHTTTGDTTTTSTYPVAGNVHALTQTTTTSPDGKAVTVGYGYDAAGNTATRPVPGGQQSLSWDAEGHLSQVREGSTSSAMVYDTDGTRLVKRDATGSTLYLPGMELRRDAATGSVSATRYYTHNGVTLAQRTTAGVRWLLPDVQGTTNLTVDATGSGQVVTQRRQKPFGDSRGTVPATWANEHGFVGGSNDATGLVHIGARDYDPGIGRFVSVDPILDAAKPASMNGYAYASNSPITFSDPTGLRDDPVGDGCFGNCPIPGGNGYADRDTGQVVRPSPSPAGTHANAGAKPAGFWQNHVVKRWNQTTRWVGEHKAVIAEVAVGVALGAACTALTAGAGVVACAIGAGAIAAAIGHTIGGEDLTLGGYGKAMALGAAGGLLGAAGGKLLGVAAKSPVGKAVAERAAGMLGRGKAGGGGAARGGVDAAEGGAARSSGQGARGCAANSFTPGTAVLLADGTTKAIEEVAPGDEVAAADPATGERGSRPVVATVTGAGDKDLVDVTVTSARIAAGDGGQVSGSAREVVTATAGHPFWVETTQSWTQAADLTIGDRLRDNDGATLQVIALRRHTESARVHNLTVEGIHTYFVVAGDTPVLVHNTGPCGPDLTAMSATGDRPAKGGLTHAGREYQKHMGRGELDVVQGRGLDSAGKNLLDDILTTPGMRTVVNSGGSFKGGTTFIRSDGIGATFDSNGVFQYFGVFR